MGDWGVVVLGTSLVALFVVPFAVPFWRDGGEGGAIGDIVSQEGSTQGGTNMHKKRKDAAL